MALSKNMDWHEEDWKGRSSAFGGGMTDKVRY